MELTKDLKEGRSTVCIPITLSPESKFWEGLSLETSHIAFHISFSKTGFHPSTPGCCTGGGAEPGGGAERAWAWLAGGGEGGAGPLPCRRQAARGTRPTCNISGFCCCLFQSVFHLVVCICPAHFLLVHAGSVPFYLSCPYTRINVIPPLSTFLLISCLPAKLSTCLPFCLSSCLPAKLSTCLLFCLSSCLPAKLSTCLPVYLSYWLSVNLSDCPPLYQSTFFLSTCLPV